MTRAGPAKMERTTLATDEAGASDCILYRRATALNVREMLQIVRTRLEGRGIDGDSCGRIELALAEALNNIVEHAFANTAPGMIRLELCIGDGSLRVSLADDGVPLPGLALPKGDLPDHRVARTGLPEGGFGWFLLHESTERIVYAHEGGWNHLTLEFQL